jgi:flagellar protein FlaG
MKVNSIFSEIGFTFHSEASAKQAASNKDHPAKEKAAAGRSSEKPESALPAKLIEEAQQRSQDAERSQRASQPIVNGFGLALEFSRDQDTGSTVIKVVNLESGDVIRQIPPDEVLAFLRHFEESNGVFLSLRL